jgi:hypothetical protein
LNRFQARFPFYPEGVRNRRRLLLAEADDRLQAKRDLNGMSMSITHNLVSQQCIF